MNCRRSSPISAGQAILPPDNIGIKSKTALRMPSEKLGHMGSFFAYFRRSSVLILAHLRSSALIYAHSRRLQRRNALDLYRLLHSAASLNSPPGRMRFGMMRLKCTSAAAEAAANRRSVLNLCPQIRFPPHKRSHNAYKLAAQAFPPRIQALNASKLTA